MASGPSSLPEVAVDGDGELIVRAAPSLDAAVRSRLVQALERLPVTVTIVDA